MKSLHVACVQFKPVMHDIRGNVKRMQEFMERACKLHRETELIVFPELAVSGYECGEKFREYAEDVSDTKSYAISRISEAAGRLGVYVAFGFPEKKTADGETRIYNSQALIGKDGQVIGSYQKVHLFDTEKLWFTPGDDYRVFDTEIGKIGLFICYDAFFPEAARILSLRGADVLVNSTNWEDPKINDMDLVMRARAIENTIYVICSNRVGRDLQLSFPGHSQIINPVGEDMEIQTDPVEDILYGELDFSYMQELRNGYYSMLSERRPDTYQELTALTK